MATLQQTVTVTWVDPTVGNGQSALQKLNIYAALDTNGSAGPLMLLGTVAPGVQTYSGPTSPMTSGAKYFFTVTAVDVNNVESQQGNWAGPLGPIGGPSPPTNVQASLG